MTSPLLAYYGDDFTGSADVMEVLQWAGLRCVLFLDPPSPKQLEQFDGLRAFGVAGWSRTMSPEEMQTELRPALRELSATGARFVHYKTCSTFDSSPQIGNIGKALELGREVFGSSLVPIVVAAPNLGRHQVFGTLFARSGLDSHPYRLDRHPTMMQHPITPMTEADLREHLKTQTELSVALVDCLQLNDEAALELDGLQGQAAAVLFDALYPQHLPRIGAAIASLAQRSTPQFLLGSSGIEYALVEHWAESGELAELRSHLPGRPRFADTEQLIVITGSCSPVNDRQIRWAEQNGFRTLALDPARLVHPATSECEVEALVQRALEQLSGGNNLILHSSRGPADPRIAETHAAFVQLGLDSQQIKLRSGRILGPQLGKVLAGILGKHALPRIAVAGGDTSGYVARELGIKALEAIAPVAPGSPLCRAHADNHLHGVEIFFKGGQVGKDDVWGTMLHGTS